MKVAMLTRDYPPTIGGVATAVESMVAALRGVGVELDVYEGRTNGRTFLLPLRRDLRTSKYDLIHVQNGPFGALARRPLVVSLHATILEEAKYYSFSRKMRTPLAYLLERRALARADAIITDGRFTTDALVEGYGVNPGRVSIIPLGVNTVNFAPAETRNWGEPRVLICSRLDRRKSIEDALVALSAVKDVPFHLTVVGDGPDRLHLERLAEQLKLGAEFTGLVSDEDLRRAFANSTVYVSSSRSEGFGLSVLQAMASGLAVVASAIPAHRELITHGQHGLLYGSRVEFVGFLKNVMSDRVLAERLGEEARKRALASSWDNVAKSILAVYKRVLDSRAT